MSTTTRERAPRVGENALRPDGPPKVQGRFAFSSDLFAEGMLWGHTLRSPHARARIRSIDITAALAVPGVHAVLTADDVPGRNAFGLDEADQPVLADDEVRYVGEAVAVVAADHPTTARLACDAIVVEYQKLEPLVDGEAALTAPPIHPDGNVIRHLVIRHGDQSALGTAAADTDGATVSVEGVYQVGMQDGRGRRGRAVRVDAVVARRPRPGGRRARSGRGAGAAHVGRRGRGVRCP
jgi:CO/xanthine dehydrogenase Mo-binding subunit